MSIYPDASGHVMITSYGQEEISSSPKWDRIGIMQQLASCITGEGIHCLQNFGH